jgi:general stress protein 26
MGKAEIIQDDETRKKYWLDTYDRHWKEGPTDPRYCLIKVTPKRIEYLDYPNYKLEKLDL